MIRLKNLDFSPQIISNDKYNKLNCKINKI